MKNEHQNQQRIHKPKNTYGEYVYSNMQNNLHCPC